jgi:hypothetical protein
MARPNRQFEGTSPVTVFASAARAAEEIFTSEIFDGSPSKARGALFVVKATAGGGTDVDVTFTIQKWNPTTMVWDTALASDGAFDTDGEQLELVVHPSVSATANRSAATTLTPKWRVTADHDHAETITYSMIAFPLI